MIILAHKRFSRREIARCVDCSPTSVSNWMNRWIDDPPENKHDIREWLKDHPRSGAPCRFSIDQRTQIIALACEKPEDHGLPVTTWTSEEIRQALIKKNIVHNISRRHVSRILLEVDLKPHRSRYWLNGKPDPEKQRKSRRSIKPTNKPGPWK